MKKHTNRRPINPRVAHKSMGSAKPLSVNRNRSQRRTREDGVGVVLRPLLFLVNPNDWPQLDHSRPKLILTTYFPFDL